MSRYKPIYHIRLVITDIKSYSTYTQLSKVELYRHVDYFHDVPISWDGTTVTCNKQATSSGEGASNLIDGSVDTKACFDSGVPSSENPVIITFSNQEGFDLTPNEYDDGDWGVYKRPVHWRWYTADDSPERDPVTYKLQISYNGIKWETVEDIDRDHWTVTNDRKALAYYNYIRLYPRHKPIDLTDLSYLKQYIDANDLALDINTQTITTEYTLYDLDTYTENGVSVYYINIPNYTICGHSAVGIIIAINIYYKIFLHTSSGRVCVNHDDGHWYELASKSAIPTNISQLNNNRYFVNGIWIGEDFYEPQDDPDSPQEDAISVFLPEYPDDVAHADAADLLIHGQDNPITSESVLNNEATYSNDGITYKIIDIADYYIIPNVSANGFILSIPWAFGAGKYLRQFFIDDDHDTPICVRTYATNHGFSAWKSLAFSEDLPDTRGTQTVSGNPITITDAEAMNAEDVKVELEPKQDLHGYDKPWAGGAGKNKLPYFTVEEKRGIRLTYDNGVVALNGTASANAYFTLSNLNLTSNNYVFSANNVIANNGVHVSLREIGADSDFADLPMNDSDKYNTYKNVSIGRVTLYVISGTQLTDFELPLQIEVGSEKTPFAPYSNICPISGYSEVNLERVGKNLYIGSPSFDGYGNRDTYQLADETYNGHEVIYKNARWNGAYKEITVYANKTYTFSAMVKCSSNATVYIFSDTGTLASATIGVTWTKISATFTFTDNITDKLRVETGDNVTIYLSEYQLEENSSATTYEPYQGSTATIDLDGTKYGGILDVTNGVLNVDRVMVDLGTKEYSYNDTALTFSSTLDAGVRYSTSEQANAVSSAFNCVSNAVLTSDLTLDASFSIHYAIEYNWINIRCLQYGSDINAFRTAMSGVQLVYELATPIQIQLTLTDIPLLENTNNVSTDGTNIQLKYQPNNVIGECKAYVERIIRQ